MKLVAHHIDFKSKGATDNPERMLTLCTECNRPENHKPGTILWNWMEDGKTVSRSYRDPTFMSILRKRLIKTFPKAAITYGNITCADRKLLGLMKSHANDAVAIALCRIHKDGLQVQDDIPVSYIQQVRKKKRSLHEANPRKGRKEPNRGAVRNNKNVKAVNGVCLFDKVHVAGAGVGWVAGFTGTNCRVQDRNSDYVSIPGKNYTQVSTALVTVLKHNGNWIRGPKTILGKG